MNRHEQVVKKYENPDNQILVTEEQYHESKAFLDSHYDSKTCGAILRSKSFFQL